MISSMLCSKDRVGSAVRCYIAWIDGVGSWLILTGQTVTIGRGSSNSILSRRTGASEADISLMANLSSTHATIDRIDESYVLTANAATRINDRVIENRAVLPDECELGLGSTVRLSFSIPTPLSASAVLTFTSGHRPRTSVDGVVLMGETCLLGPGGGQHIACYGWPGGVVLVRTADGLAVKSRQPVMVDGRPALKMTSVSNGQIVSADELRFRLEPLA